MDWSNERYVRVYVRDTADWSVLSWQARALWVLVMRKLDRSGVLATLKGARGVAALVGMPIEEAEPALTDLLEDGCLVAVAGGYVAPNFVDAQEAKQSDRLRAAESRGRRRDVALGIVTSDQPESHDVTKRDGTVTKRDADVTNRDEKSHGVTRSHTASHAVTPCHSVLSRAVPSRTDSEGEPPSAEPPPPRKRKTPKHPMPAAWAPSAPLVAHALELGLDASREANKFFDWTQADGRVYADWDAAFRSHLNCEADRPGRQGTSKPRAVSRIPRDPMATPLPPEFSRSPLFGGDP